MLVHDEIIYDEPYLCFDLGENKKILGLDLLPFKINELLPFALSGNTLFSYTYSSSNYIGGGNIIISSYNSYLI